MFLHLSQRPDGMLKLYDLSDDPDRRLFLDKLIMYQEERGTPLSQCPTISKQPLDLYKLYMAAKERGGFVEVRFIYMYMCVDFITFTFVSPLY